MSAYAIFEVRPNPDATDEQLRNYDEYKSQVPKLISKFGGTYVIRGGSAVGLVGDPPAPRWHVIEFPDQESAQSFWNSPEYKSIKHLRDGAAEVRAVVITA
jgi:uncharacterized protein (DUF1330 family)